MQNVKMDRYYRGSELPMLPINLRYFLSWLTELELPPACAFLAASLSNNPSEVKVWASLIKAQPNWLTPNLIGWYKTPQEFPKPRAANHECHFHSRALPRAL